jgi:hypothetical protein
VTAAVLLTPAEVISTRAPTRTRVGRRQQASASQQPLNQLTFNLELPATSPPVLSVRVPAGGARLLRKLIASGMDLGALEQAAALCAHLDAEPAA